MMAIIELPKDAQGREIPLDTECLYMKDGTKQNVDGFMFCRRDAEWSVETHIAIYDTEELYLTPPDSWEKLEEDLNRAVENGDAGDEPLYQTMACAYMNHGGETCGGCKFWNKYVRNCTNQMLEDVVSRIRRLRGDH